MLLKTLLNRVHRFRSHVYGAVRLLEDAGQLLLEVDVHPRSNGVVLCSICSARAPLYDTLPLARRFDFVPLWNIPVAIAD